MNDSFPTELHDLDYGPPFRLHQVARLEASCVRCGSTDNLKACNNCKLLFTCEAHRDDDMIAEHDSVCIMLRLAESTLETWRKRYQALLGVDPDKCCASQRDVLERNAVLDPSETQCRDRECVGLQKESPVEVSWRSVIAAGLWKYSFLFNDDREDEDKKCCSHFYELASEKVFMALYELANRTLSGPAVERLLHHGLRMLHQGMIDPFTPYGEEDDDDDIFYDERVPPFIFLLALKFDLPSVIEGHSYNAILTNFLLCGLWNRHRYRKRNLMDMPRYAGAIGAWNAERLSNVIFRFLDSPPFKINLPLDIKGLLPSTMETDRLIDEGPRWNEGDDAVQLILTLRAMADLVAMRELPYILDSLLPPDLILEVQLHLSTNPIILRHKPLQMAIKYGKDLKPYYMSLKQLAGALMEKREKDESLVFTDATKADKESCFRLQSTPLFMPELRAFKALRDPYDAMVSSVIAKIPGASDFTRRWCLRKYPRTMSTLQATKVFNPRKAFLVALEERKVETLSRRSYDNGEEAAEYAFPRRQRRASETSQHEGILFEDYRLFKHCNKAWTAQHTIEGEARYRWEMSPFFIPPSLPCPWDNVLKITLDGGGAARKRRFSFDSKETSARIDRLARYDLNERAPGLPEPSSAEDPRKWRKYRESDF